MANVWIATLQTPEEAIVKFVEERKPIVLFVTCFTDLFQKKCGHYTLVTIVVAAIRIIYTRAPKQRILTIW